MHEFLVVAVAVVLCLLGAVVIHGLLPRPDGRPGWLWPRQ